jgi:heat shock 70kDa protein 4
MGHGKTTCTVASFTDKKVTILSHASNRNLGGRNFDYLLCDILGEEFNKKFGCDPRKAPKARLRMLDQIEKTRKILSANSDAQVNIECLLEDQDLHRNLTRDELEQLIQPNIDELKKVCIEALEKCKIKTQDIDCVELVGEATRMPIVQRVVEEIFEKDKHQRTINSSEVVARGCSLMAAMILPQYHVANFEIRESNSFPIDVAWSVSDGKMKNQTLFPKGNNFPSVKSLTFDGRSEPMDVGISYTSMDGIVNGLPQLLARYRIEPPKPKEEKFGLKLRIQLDQNSIPALDSAELIEEYIEIRKIPVKMDTPAAPTKKEPKEGEAAEEGAKEADSKEPEQQYEEKEVKKTRSTQIHFKFEQHGYGAKQIDEFVQAEDAMCKQDNVILDVKIMRNHLETYVYDMRAALDTIGNYSEFMKEQDRGDFLELLNQTESWIYDEGESAARDIYEQKLRDLEKIGEPVKIRYRFHDIFPSRMSDFESTVNEIFQKAAEIPDDSHITAEEKENLMKECQENLEWASNSKQVQNSISLHEDPTVDLTEIDTRKHKLISLAETILNKPVPKKEEPKAEDKKEDEKKEDDKKEDAKDEAPEGEKDTDMKE